MITRTASILTLAIVLLGAGKISAQQNGTITGTIIDGSTGETLFGASVIIQGTSRGASTSGDGEFVIPNVPAGDLTLEATYIGYEREILDLTLEPGEELEVTIELGWSGVTGEEVIISAQAQGQVGAINEQIRSRRIKNIVSSERIRELPDDNAATALSRLPGVSLQEGDKVVIRGMEAKLNTVMVNGVQLPSTDMEDRSTNLGFISSNMLDGIEVTKSITPDMDANSIGGAVNLRLREAPSGLHFDLLTQGSYNTMNHSIPAGDNYQVWTSVSNRFLDDRLGVFIQGNAQRTDGGSHIASTNFSRMGTGAGLGYGEATYGMDEFLFIDHASINEEYGGSLLLDYDLPNGSLKMQNTLALTNSDIARHRDILFFATTQRQYRMTRDVYEKQLLINALQGEHTFGNLEVDYGVSRATSERVTDLRYGDPAENFGFANADPEVPPFEQQDEADRLSLTHEDVYNMDLYENDWENASIFQFAGTRDEDFNQRIWNTYLNFNYPVALGDWISGELAAGGKINQSRRENDTERTYVRVVEPGRNECAADWMESVDIDPSQQLQFVDFRDHDYDRAEYFLGGEREFNNAFNLNYLDQYIRLASPCWSNHRADSHRNDFTGNETTTAGYFLGDFDIGSNISVLAGVRYEHFNLDYDANFVFMTHGVDGTALIPNQTEPEDEQSALRREVADSLTKVDHSVDHWFPNLQLRYHLTDWADVRFAYTKSLSRPDYVALIPNIFRESSNAGEAGNPYLRPSVSQNYDANISFYTNRLGLLTIGGFYKKIDDVFFDISRLYRALPEDVAFPEPEIFERLEMTVPSQGAAISTWMNNPNPAYVHGYEIDFQTNFWYLPSPLNAVVLNVNYTRAFSEMDYQQIRITEERRIIDGRPTTVTMEEDTVRTARLLHQGDHIINVALGIDYKGFSGRLSYRLQGDVITSVGSRPEEDEFAENIYGWDFTLRQRLPFEGLTMFLSGVNITHAPEKNYRYFRQSVEEEPSSQLRTTTYNSRRFELGVRYSF